MCEVDIGPDCRTEVKYAQGPAAAVWTVTTAHAFFVQSVQKLGQKREMGEEEGGETTLATKQRGMCSQRSGFIHPPSRNCHRRRTPS